MTLAHNLNTYKTLLGQEEQRGDVNYYGFSKAFGFGKGKGGILKTIFEWEGNVKPVIPTLYHAGTHC